MQTTQLSGTLRQEHKRALEFLFQKARTCFKTYLLLFNPPGHSPFIFSDLHEYLAERIQQVCDGQIGKRQAISVPPQHGKSTICSIEAASWLLGRMPGIQIAIAGFSVELVTTFSKAVRSRIESPFYKQIFPGVDIVFGSNRMDNWRLTNGSAMMAKTPGNKLTGRRVDWLIIDDPHAGREEAESLTQRKRVIDWYFADCFSRLSPGASVFIIATRWHPQDLIGHLTSEEHERELRTAGQEGEIFEVVNLPAICENPEEDPLGREEGEALFPEVRDEAFLAAIKANVPAYEWSSQFQGKPKASGSGQVDTSKINWIESIRDVPRHLEIVRGWDFALTEKQKADYTAGALCAYDENEDKFYIIEVFRNKRTWTKNRKVVLEMAEEDKLSKDVNRMGVEAVAGFLAVYQDLRDALMGEVKVTPQNPPGGGKLTRALPWLNKIEAGRCYIVQAAWKKEFIEELEGFPDGDHDDQVDAVSICWEMLTGRNRNGRKTPLERPVIEDRPNPERPGSTPERDREAENLEDMRQEPVRRPRAVAPPRQAAVEVIDYTT